MHIRDFGRTCAKISLATVLSGSLIVASYPLAPAYADLASDLQTAQAQLESLGTEYQKLQDELTQAAAELEETKGQIEETSLELADAQTLLASNVSEDYKDGGAQALDVLFGATSFDDLVSRLFYINKVSDAQVEAINNVQVLKQQLEDQQAQQEQSVADTQDKVDEAKANQDAAQALVNSLSTEMQEQLAAEAEKNEALAAGMQSAEDGAAGTLDQGSVQMPSSSTGNSAATGNSSSSSTGSSSTGNGGSSSAGGSSSTGGSGNGSQGGNSSSSGSSGSGSSGTSSVGGAALSYALSMEGVPYVYGGASPSGFDCSGLVVWAYAKLGISLPHGAAYQARYVQQHGRWTTNVNELQYGDLVFYSGHVAFYAGNGQVFGAWRPGRGVGYGSIYACGTPYGGGNI